MYYVYMSRANEIEFADYLEWKKDWFLRRAFFIDYAKMYGPLHLFLSVD